MVWVFSDLTKQEKVTKVTNIQIEGVVVLGITKLYQILAWGGGIERIAMLKYDLDDVREFYNNNLGWLRSTTKCQ